MGWSASISAARRTAYPYPPRRARRPTAACEAAYHSGAGASRRLQHLFRRRLAREGAGDGETKTIRRKVGRGQLAQIARGQRLDLAQDLAGQAHAVELEHVAD